MSPAPRRSRGTAGAQVSNVVCGPLAAAVALGAGVLLARRGQLAVDFRASYLPAARKLLHGQSPYPLHAVRDISRGVGLVYPPLTAWLTVPFTMLPSGVATAAVTVLALAGVPTALYLLGVRDWRCYGCALLWPPVLESIQTGNVTIPLLLALAAAWRWRDRAFVAASAIGFAVALKLFLAPLVLWLAATRRYRAAAAAAAASVGLILVPWAAADFRGFAAYPGLLRTAERIEGPLSYGLAGQAHLLGLPATLGVAVGYLGGLGLALAALPLGRAGREREAMTVAVAASLVASPIVWLHYLSLLLVPLALARPCLDWLWWVPLPLWVCSGGVPGSGFQRAIFVLVATTVALGSVRGSDRRSPAARRSSTTRSDYPVAASEAGRA